MNSRQRVPARRAVESDAPRRVPSQDRGQKRVEELLDAAEAVIAEVGVDEATTNAIAARAGAGVGSLYHFFPNKEAIVAALSTRYQAELLEVARVMLDPAMTTIPLAEMASRIVLPIAQYLRRRPAYLKVYRATAAPNGPVSCHLELHEEVVGIVEQLMRSRSPTRDRQSLHVSAVAAVEMVHHLLEFAEGQPPKKRQALVRETIRLVSIHAEMVSSGADPLTTRSVDRT